MFLVLSSSSRISWTHKEAPLHTQKFTSLSVYTGTCWHAQTMFALKSSVFHPELENALLSGCVLHHLFSFQNLWAALQVPEGEPHIALFKRTKQEAGPLLIPSLPTLPCPTPTPLLFPHSSVPNATACLWVHAICKIQHIFASQKSAHYVQMCVCSEIFER